MSSKKPQQDNINIYIRTSIYSYLNIGGMLHSIGGGGSIISAASSSAAASSASAAAAASQECLGLVIAQ